jgi:hypothetical protein
MTSFQARPMLSARTAPGLAALIDREVERSERMLFTLTPRESLDALGRSQQLLDLGFVQQVRAIVAAHCWSTKQQREFASDELALALGVGTGTAARLLHEALGLSALPGMVEAIEAGWLTQHHAKAVLRELDEVEGLSVEQRAAVGTIVLARLSSQTPHELRLMTRRLVLQIDLGAARSREDVASRKRQVAVWSSASGQGVVQGRGPLLQIEAIRASLKTWLTEHPKAPDDERSEGEREFDLYVSLLTGGVEAGSWQAAIVVPFTTADGGDLELAEIPGLGPVLPSTARDVLTDAEWSQVAVDPDGAVIAVSDPLSGAAPAPAGPAMPPPARAAAPSPFDRTFQPDSGAQCPDKAARLAELRRRISQSPTDKAMPVRLSIAGYVASARLRRFVQARDQHCVFPGCHRQITDVDHRIPWPLGPTAAHNLQLLCRHHHRAKQAVFTVELTRDGDYLWTSRGGWQFLRHRQGY